MRPHSRGTMGHFTEGEKKVLFVNLLREVNWLERRDVTMKAEVGMMLCEDKEAISQGI